MAKQIDRIGFGQVEPNHMSYKRTGQIYAQLPAASDIEVLENGQFVKYDYANKEVNLTGEGEWLMVYNEIKLYDEREQSYKDYAMIKEAFTPGSDITHEGYGPFEGQMVPRVVKTNVGDIFTTNTIKVGNTNNKLVAEGEELEIGDILGINAQGYLSKDGDTSEIKFQVVKPLSSAAFATMPDGQPAVKVMRIK